MSDDVDAEIALHLELRGKQLQEQGFLATQAREEALRRFGTRDEARQSLVHAAQQRDRSMRIKDRTDAIGQDLRYAVRGLRREPSFTVFVVAVLALGIGANATMFGVADRLLLRGPEHVIAPERVVRFYVTRNTPGQVAVPGSTLGYVSYENFRDATHVFQGVAAYQGSRPRVLGRGIDAQQVSGAYATASFFPLLGVRPLIGRFFSAAEDSPSTPEHVAILGYDVWRRVYAGDPTIVGRTIVIDDTPVTVIGVAPRDFTGAELSTVDLWQPMSVGSQDITSGWQRTWNASWLQVIARLKPGVTRSQADVDATAAHRRTYDGDSKTLAEARVTVAPLRYTTAGEESAETVISGWLVGVALAVLLIACSNIINLLLARAVRRGREIAVRLALGASRGRLVRLLLTEGLLLALLGGVGALAVAYAVGNVVRAALFRDVQWSSTPIDMRVLVVTACIALVTGVLIGLVPALLASRPALVSALKSGTREGGGRRSRLRRALTMAQTALSVVLLVGAGLFVASLKHVQGIDLGMQPEQVLVVSFWWPTIDNGATSEQRRQAKVRRNAFLSIALEATRALPGVEHASLTLGLPFQSSYKKSLSISGYDSLNSLGNRYPTVSAVDVDYFATVGTRLQRGRTFDAGDRRGGERVAIVSESMAKFFWPRGTPLGSCLVIADTLGRCWRIIGVVADTKKFAIVEDPSMHYYVPLEQADSLGIGGTLLVVRPRGDANAFGPTVRRAVQSLDPSLSFVNVKTLQQEIEPQVRPWQLGATMFGLFGLLALAVAAVGLYSLMAYLVTQRTQELGIRAALGARGIDIIGLVMREGLATAALGIVIGLCLILIFGRFLAPLLFQISPYDPVVLGGVAGMLLTVAAVATVGPAARAKRVSPMTALRAE